jgi:hypothetical protein
MKLVLPLMVLVKGSQDAGRVRFVVARTWQATPGMPENWQNCRGEKRRRRLSGAFVYSVIQA